MYVTITKKDYKSRVGKVSFWELYLQQKFPHSDNICNPKSVQENETKKFSEMNHRIQARRLDLVLKKKKKRTSQLGDFFVPEIK